MLDRNALVGGFICISSHKMAGMLFVRVLKNIVSIFRLISSVIKFDLDRVKFDLDCVAFDLDNPTQVPFATSGIRGPVGLCYTRDRRSTC